MFNLEKEFLSIDPQKYIPIHLMKMNYGFASENADDIETYLANNALSTKSLEIVVPSDDSVVVMLISIIGEDGTTEDISQIETAPPGKNSVNLKIIEGRTYWIYIISKKYVDGYITKDLIVSPESTETTRLEITVESAEQSIDLSVENRMQLAIDESDPTQWYNYQGSYSGPLVWNAPDILGNPGSQAWLIYARDVLTYFKRDFELKKVNDFSVSNKQDVINIFAVMTDIAKFMKDYRNDIDEQTNNNLIPYWDFLDSNFIEDQNGNQGYQYLNPNLHNDLAGASVLADYIDYSSDGGWTNGVGYRVYVHTLRRLVNPGDYATYIPIYDTDNEIYGSLDGLVVDRRTDNDTINQNIVFPDGTVGTTEFLGEAIRSYVRKHHDDLSKSLSDQGIQIFDRNPNSAENWWNTIGAIASQYYNNVWNWLIDSLNEIEVAIAAAGNEIWNPDYTGSTSSVAHEATLQNLRFVKNSVLDLQNNVWTTLINSNALMFKLIQKIQNASETQNTKVNSLNSLTSASVAGSDLEVLYKDSLSTVGGWIPLGTSVIDSSDEIKTLNLNIPQFRTSGAYVIMVRPQRIPINIVEASGDIIRTQDENGVLDNYQEKNAFYGWNIKFQDKNGNQLGEERIITSSLWSISGQRLQISPKIEGKIDFEENTRATIWSNAFIPIMIHVKIVDQNALTLSYSMYAKKEFNTNTGLCTIYDYAGNIYKQLSIGRKADDSTDLDIVEFREPV